MTALLHQVTIDAPPEAVFDALTTEEGLKGWWTTDVEARPEAGSTAVFGFANRSTVFRMRIDELDRPKRLVWSCSSDNAEWQGTKLTFDLTLRDSTTVVNFTHAGWRSTEGVLRLCNTHWGHLMVRLKQFVEDEAPGPFFRD